MNLAFKEKCFSKGDRIQTTMPYKEMYWLWKLLGFKYEYGLLVLEEPKQKGDNWIYEVEYNSLKLYWLKFKLKDYERNIIQ